MTDQEKFNPEPYLKLADELEGRPGDEASVEIAKAIRELCRLLCEYPIKENADEESQTDNVR
jgi:hypothetical protein